MGFIPQADVATVLAEHLQHLRSRVSSDTRFGYDGIECRFDHQSGVGAWACVARDGRVLLLQDIVVEPDGSIGLDLRLSAASAFSDTMSRFGTEEVYNGHQVNSRGWQNYLQGLITSEGVAIFTPHELGLRS